MLVACDVDDANSVQIIDSRAQSNRIGDAARAGFKALRRRLVERLLEGHILNHVAATLPRWHLIQHLGAAVDLSLIHI